MKLKFLHWLALCLASQFAATGVPWELGSRVPTVFQLIVRHQQVPPSTIPSVDYEDAVISR